MGELATGLVFGIGTFLLLLSGMSVAFALGFMSILFIFLFMPPGAIWTIPQAIYGGAGDFTLLAIPLFILMGECIGRSRASKDLYESTYRWLNRVPGGLGIANVIGCAIFAAMCGSSTATSAAIGSMGIPEMQRRGYRGGLAGGLIAAGGTLGNLIPPSIPFIIYGIVAQASIGKLFIAGIVPGVLLAIMFAGWVSLKSHLDNKAGLVTQGDSVHKTIQYDAFTWRQRFESLPRLGPFVVIIVIVIGALYGGFATPTEAAGVGALSTFIMAVVVYRCYHFNELKAILSNATRESCMIVMIIAISFLYTYVMSYLHISQSTTEWLVSLEMSRWLFLFWIDILIVILGFFLPPVAIIVFIVPIILPALQARGFDTIWFGVQMTILVEAGMIHPPLGLNLFVIQGIAPEISLKELMWGVTPFIIIIMISMLMVAVWPQIILWLPGQMF